MVSAMKSRWMGHLESSSYLLWNIVVMVIPVAILGLAARRLTPSAFGVLSFAYAVSGVITTISEFGFNLVGARAVAQARDSEQATTEVVSGIFLARIPVTFGAIALAVACGVLFPYFHNNQLYTLSLAASGVWSSFQCMWYYQGSMRFYWAVFAEVIGRGAGLVLLIFLLRSDADAWQVIAFVSGGALIAEVFLALPVLRKFSFEAGLRCARTWFRAGMQTFAYRVTTSTYFNATTIILSIFVAPAFLGNFSIAEKATRAIVRTTYFIYGSRFALFSRLFRDSVPAAFQAVLQTLRILVGFSTVCVVTTMIFAPTIVYILLGHRSDEAVLLTRIMALLILPSSITVFTCDAALAAAGRTNRMISMYLVGWVTTATGFLLIYLFCSKQANGMVAIQPVIAAELFMVSYSGWLLYRLWRTSMPPGNPGVQLG